MQGAIPEMQQEPWTGLLRTAMDPAILGTPEGETVQRIPLSNDTSASEAQPEAPGPSICEAWGFVGYRLDYRHTDEERETFKQNLSDEASKHGTG